MKKLLTLITLSLFLSSAFAVSNALNILNATKYSYINVCGYVIRPHHMMSFYYNGIILDCRNPYQHSSTKLFNMFITNEEYSFVEDLGVFKHSYQDGIIDWMWPANWGSNKYLLAVNKSSITVDDYKNIP